ncbi:hypothetical protein DYB32_003438 [Aphanomyces invadans]|uniref:Uncharacterized protein n=1 Tax=Aphanomyces invadans TaxID=157072 RepID=A0A418B0J1_9STRA|nr:hypothetical protein DYB32_003438 [Aphanomyces invadans]
MDAMLTIFPAALLVLSWLLSASRVLLGMAASRLVCRCLRNRMLLHRAPVLALLVCGVASITFATFASFVPSFRPLDLAIACALFRQMAQCLGFLYLHRMFKHLSDSLRSLWNVARAVAAFVVWLGSFVSLLCLAPNGKTTALVIGVLVSLATVYYFFHVKDAQKYSDAERKSLMFAHVILFNYNKTKQMQRRCRRESLAARRQSMTTPSVPSMPPPSSAKSMQKYTFPPEPARRVVVLSRRNTTVESNFIIRDGKVIPIPATATSPAKTAANNERRKSSAHSIELATLE